MATPLPCRWDGEAFAPLPRFAKLADEQFVIGKVYTLAEVLKRSAKSHAHYFACVTEAWKNLPESYGDRYPTDEHLRKSALIKAGYRDERSLVCSSRAEALRLASFVSAMDDYAIVTVVASVVTVYTAKSQNEKAMDGPTFQASKDAVLGILAEMIGVEPTTLSSAAKDGRAPNKALPSLPHAA